MHLWYVLEKTGVAVRGILLDRKGQARIVDSSIIAEISNILIRFSSDPAQSVTVNSA
jgi:hypothetical protein